ncbi:hypothetical protein SmJEL517_g03261 [Synchytrium microbalum]|uniref:Proteasome subunit beta n=1 Tax=Synchytrium microbalum TaxID=1806994 RepID=A0A507C7P7_9FUNG|nr:uncharacterized protein SmJEL517_g03261 [Synchytrium microbalum]TPX34016.1 hypothetical protein SmJEL517_g03261 [Synchytrium microbalum]
MEVLIGITGKDFVLCAADATAARSIVVMKSGEDKSRELNKNTLMLYTGEAGDTVQFAEYIQRNIQLYTIKNGIQLSTTATANFTRRELADSLRSRVSLVCNERVGCVVEDMCRCLVIVINISTTTYTPMHPTIQNSYKVNLLIAGCDPKSGTPELHWLDYLASSVKLNFAAQGYASYFTMATMDRFWQPDMSLEEAIALLRKCLHELKVRFVGNLPLFVVKVVDKNGIRVIEL